MPAWKQFLVKTAPLTAIFLVVFTIKSYGEDPCKNIADLDDKAKCYEEQVEKKEQEYQSTSKKLEEIRNTKNSINSKITQLSSQLTVTQKEINELEAGIKDVQEKLEEINLKLMERKDQLTTKIEIRNRILRTYSKRSLSSHVDIFSGWADKPAGLNGFQYAALTQNFSKSLMEHTLHLIGGLNSEITTYEKNKQEAQELKSDLENSKNQFLAVKKDLDSKKAIAQNDFNKASQTENSIQGKLNNLQKEISDLSSKQKEILNAKNGEGTGSVGDYESPEAKTPAAPFKPAFAFFSYGAYTHYNGMSQYGAKGRAEDGQKYKEILKFYYKVDTEKKSDFPSKISVQGYGDIDFQYYLYGLAEMPTDWPIEALKAQAIAGRTYAYKAKKPICTTESCQVFNKSKADKVKSGQYPNWKKAVDDTKSEILKNSATSQYSSTTGGYINNVGWDGKWPKDSYERQAGSPWFYKAWYTKGYSSSDSCGRGHPWLNEKEMADILNAWVVWDHGDSKHISPVTTSCWGGDPYSLDEMAKKADDYGKKYSKVSSVSVDIGNNGITSKITFQTDQGSLSLSGETFKTVFNLRAPGYISIKSRLFDVEHKK